MKKYKVGDIYILDVNKVTEYAYPNWYERITRSNQLSNRVVAAMVYDNKIGRVVYITGTGVKIYGCSGDTNQIGDLFVKNKIALGLTKAASTLPKKITTDWMNNFQTYLQKQDEKASNTRFIEDLLIENTIQTIQEYITCAVEELQKPRANKKNFNTGKISAYEDCIILLKELLNKENKSE